MTKTPPPARIAVAEARQAPNSPGRLSALLLKHGSMELRWYAPRGEDAQTPHNQDEIYIVATGTGTFLRAGERFRFGPGDALFVDEHRFIDFSEDFAVWVVFYGPAGGEAQG